MGRIPDPAIATVFLLLVSGLSLWPGNQLVAAQHAASPQDAESADAAKKVKGLLTARCFQCHGENGVAAKDVFVLDRDRLIRDKVVAPKDRTSLLLRQVETGAMPAVGEKLNLEEIALLQKWVDLGAPAFDATPQKSRAFLSEEMLAAEIERDLRAADPRSQKFIRYYSIAHLYNSGVPDAELDGYRLGLAKLLNSLSWHRDIAVPKPINDSATLLRIDLRQFKWSAAIWNKVLAAYPFGYRAKGWKAVHDLSGAEIPYVRADWFVARASLPPLYHEALDLPTTLKDLERRLEVDPAHNLEIEADVVRGGVTNSGVSRNNRVVERNASPHGAYWKSFDFATSQGEQNILQNPLDLKPAGGEMIFNLPNGMQAYFIVDAKGERLDEAPTAIVSDRNHPEDPVVRNGISCMGCHYAGMKTFKDVVRRDLEHRVGEKFEKAKALAIYRPQEDLDRLLSSDSARFAAAVQQAGGTISVDHRTEPINALFRKFGADMTVSLAAAEVGLELSAFVEGLKKSRVLRELGIGQLLFTDGSIKRDTWEEHFGAIVRELGVGEPHRAGRAPVPTVRKPPPRPKLSWAQVLEERPDPKIIPNAEHRKAIEATGLPWRVTDKKTAIELLLIPSGTYQQGAIASDAAAHANEKPSHSVTITRPFYLGRFPVLNEEYLRSKLDHKSGTYGGFDFTAPYLPVVNVSWNDAMSFCIDHGFRLPTESEWEYACRAGSTDVRYGAIEAIGWYRDNSGGHTHAVGKKAANAFGLFDMIGNVWEWCADWHSEDEYSRRGSGVVDPNGPLTGTSRTLRGGTWGSPREVCCSSFRGQGDPAFQGDETGGYVGFRVARTIWEEGGAGPASNLQTAFARAIKTLADDRIGATLAVKLADNTAGQLLDLDQVGPAKSLWGVLDAKYGSHATFGPQLRAFVASRLTDLGQIGTEPKPFTVQVMDGRTISLADFRGRVVLLVFWASWSAPDRAEAPTWSTVYEKYHSQGVEVIGVSLDERDRTVLESFLAQHPEMRWPQFYDGNHWKNALAVLYGIQAIPNNYLIDREGKIFRVGLRGEALQRAVGMALAK